MKKLYISIIVGVFIFFIKFSFGQSDVSGPVVGHQGSSNTTYYVGWDNNTTFDLDVKHMATGANSKNINFFTSATQRMSLSSTGNLGLSNTWPFTPLSLIHLNQNAAVSFSTRFTNFNTTNGSLFGIGANGDAEINQQDPLQINFLTNNVQRVTIRGFNNHPLAAGGLSNVGYVGIGLPDPSSPLTVQGDASAGGIIIPGANWRNAIMIRNHGTLIFDGDRAITPANRDFFMAHPSVNPLGDYWEGLVPGIDGNGVQYVYRLYGRSRANEPTQGEHEFFTNVLADSRVGVNTLFPSQRVEIVDGANQQLRLTNTQSVATPANSIYTDLQTTANGDLFINASNAGTERRVGIETSTPGNTLQIKSPGNTVSNTGAGSGLRFSNMNNSVIPQTNPDPDKGVLSVDGNGDVIFVRDEGGGGTGTGDVTACTVVGGTNANYITKWTGAKEICRTSGIFEMPSGTNNVGIGTTTPANKLEVTGDINVSSYTNCIRASGKKIIGLGGNNTTTLVGIDAGGLDNNVTLNVPLGDDNTLVGNQAGFGFPPAANGVTMTGNTCLGAHAGLVLGSAAVTGEADWNTYVGYYCAQSATNGRGNTAVGFHCGSSNANGTGSGISSVGVEALTNNTTGEGNAALGYWSLR